MKKQELIKHIEDLPYKEGPIVDKIDISRKGLLELVKQLDEPPKVTIPQFEKDKWYIVKIKNLDSDVRVLKKRNRWYFGGDWDDERDIGLKIHTRKELEESGFGWVFDCPGIEIEEVEE